MDMQKEWSQSEFRNQESLFSHREIETELPFYAAIAEGNEDYIAKNLAENSFSNPEGMGRLSEDPVQNMRYHFVVTMALITRYIIHAGMEQEKAYSLSDFYIQHMDKLNTIEEITALHNLMCTDICKQMRDIRNKQIFSKPIVLCMDYIYQHIHYRITVSELAEYLELSDSYLSRLFKKETGMALSTYITEQKIEKAKNLLQYSDYKIVDIANYLAFSSQSHFIQTFQKVTGMTPHKYKTQYFRNNWDHFSAGKLPDQE